MALKKTIVKANGTSTEYHKISNIRVGKRNNDDIDYAVVVVVDSYVSTEIRNKGANLIAVRNSKSLTATLEEIESKPILALAYDKLKETEDFKGAEDC